MRSDALGGGFPESPGTARPSLIGALLAKLGGSAQTRGLSRSIEPKPAQSVCSVGTELTSRFAKLCAVLERN